MEVAEKDELKDLLIEGRIHKTKVTIDEAKELPDLDCIKSLSAEPGQIMLSTFYIGTVVKFRHYESIGRLSL